MKRVVVPTLLALSLASVAASQELPAETQELTAPESDRAGRVARIIAREVPHFRNYRGEQVHGLWRVDERARWSIRAESECLQELRSLGIEVEPFTTNVTPIPTPVRLIGEVGGVRYRKRRAAAVFVISCELAARLPRLSAVLRGHDIHTVEVLSTWRRTPPESFHRMGLAMDLHTFHAADRSFVVERDYAPDLSQPTCPAPPDAAFLQELACELAAGGFLSTVITPSYSEGHHDHFHVDVRPDDARVFVR
jgi:hypothetical protein